jgi:hypothetical protein
MDNDTVLAAVFTSSSRRPASNGGGYRISAGRRELPLSISLSVFITL